MLEMEDEDGAYSFWQTLYIYCEFRLPALCKRGKEFESVDVFTMRYGADCRVRL